MNITHHSTDEATLTELGHRLARARLDRNLTQAEVARRAGIAKRTLERMESGGSVQLTTLLRVCRTLNLLANFDALLPAAGPSPIEQLKLRGKLRRRASGVSEDTPAAPWRWGDET